MRAFGEALLPARYGGYDMLDSEARRTAAHTDDIWGAGGYVWVYLDALAHEMIRAEGAESCYIDYHPSFGGSPFGKVIWK